MIWKRHKHMPGTQAAYGRRGVYEITDMGAYFVLTARGHDGLSMLMHTPAGTAQIPAEGKVVRSEDLAKRLAGVFDSVPDYEAGVSGT